jgi:hypothetical protein
MLQVSDCSTVRIKSDVPRTAVFIMNSFSFRIILFLWGI